jgi:hypothetical protein
VTAARHGGEISRAYGVWRWTGRLSLAPSLADLIGARIDGLSAGVRDVLELVAFGEPLGLPLLRAAVGSAAGPPAGRGGHAGRCRLRRPRTARHRAPVRRRAGGGAGRLDAASGAPPARRITARATVAFWGLGRPDAAAELAAGRTGDAADRARMRAVEALMRLQLKQIDPARELADGVLADPRAAGPRISDVRRGGGGHRGPAVPRRPGPAGAGRRHAAGRRPGPL